MIELVEALPQLTEPELEQLQMAVDVRVQHLRAIISTAQGSQILDEARQALVINQSLSTAISETRMSLEARRQYLEQELATLTKAEPGEDGLCMHCKQEIKSVPGGQGPTFIHTDTQVVVCAKRPTDANG